MILACVGCLNVFVQQENSDPTQEGAFDDMMEAAREYDEEGRVSRMAFNPYVKFAQVCASRTVIKCGTLCTKLCQTMTRRW